MLCKDGLLCTLGPGSMPEGMRAGVESGIVHPPLPPKAYIYGKPLPGKPLLILEPKTLHLDSLPHIPVPKFGPDPQGMSLIFLLCQT